MSFGKEVQDLLNVSETNLRKLVKKPKKVYTLEILMSCL